MAAPLPPPSEPLAIPSVQTRSSSVSVPVNTSPNHFHDSVSPRSSSPWTKRVSALFEDHVAPPPVVDGVITATIPEDIRIEPPLWSECLIGFFISEPPHIGKIHATVNRIWKPKDSKMMIDAHFINSTSVLFRIPMASTREWILRRRFWFVGEAPLVVQQWSPTLSNLSPDLSNIPLWVDLRHVPDFLFSHKGLKHLGDLIGNFQKLHPNTERCYRLDIARLMIAVDLNKPLPEKIVLDQENTQPITVSFPWLPMKCSLCHRWGHVKDKCTSSSPSDVQRNEDTGEVQPETDNTHSLPTIRTTLLPLPEHVDRSQASHSNHDPSMLHSGSPTLPIPQSDQPMSIDQIKTAASLQDEESLYLPVASEVNDAAADKTNLVLHDEEGWSTVQRGHKNAISPNRIIVNQNSHASSSSLQLLATLGDKEEGEINEFSPQHTTVPHGSDDIPKTSEDVILPATVEVKTTKRNGQNKNRSQPPIFPNKAIGHVQQQITKSKASSGKRK